jgi:beta-N-acetylhexosaminidase
VLLSALISAAIAAVTPVVAGADAAAPSAAAKLPLAQAAGQHVIGSLSGTTIPAALAARIRRGELAGVILFSRNIGSRAQLRALTAGLQAERRRGPRALRDRPLLVMIDQEGGLVKRLSGAPDHSPGELAQIGSVALARREGLATARNLRDVGVNVDLAPVLDIGRPHSSVRALGRSYGSTPARVEALGGAFADGLAAAGVLACAKHFPGLGGATVDEDLRLNRITLPLDTLRAVDEAPFRDAAKRGIPLVMVSTGVYPALSSAAAMFSPRIAGSELRRRVGFKGVALTDDLEVPALAGRSAERNALDATRAGEDLLLFAQSDAAAVRGAGALVRAVTAGTLPRATIDAGTSRVLALRDRLR